MRRAYKRKPGLTVKRHDILPGYQPQRAGACARQRGKHSVNRIYKALPRPKQSKQIDAFANINTPTGGSRADD